MPESNNQSQPQQPQYVYVQPPYYNRRNDVIEIDLVEIVKYLWKRKMKIFLVTFIFAVASLAYALHAPFIYRSECRFLPPTSGGGRLASLAAQYGGIASMMGVSLPGKATTGQMMLGVMQGDSVVDSIIDKFNLMEENEWEYRVNARASVLKNLETKEDNNSGIVSVAYLDKDPQRAADIVNAFVEGLRKKLLDMSIEDAQQSRIFFENQLIQAQEELSGAEDALMKYQQSSGVVSISEQASALISAITTLRNQIAAKNVEISSLQSYARRDNPQLKLAQSQLAGLQKELRRLEEEQRRTDVSASGRKVSGDIMLSAGEIPELGLEYQRYLRAFKIAEAKYEMMLRQYENSRLVEANDVSTISIVDPAMPPDYKYKPSRARICIIGTMAGFMLMSGIYSFSYVFKESQKNKKKKDDDEDYDDDY